MPSNEYVTPTETTTPIAATTAGLFTFATPASFLLITNRSGKIVYYRFNSADDASVATHDLSLSNGVSLNLKAEDYGVGTFATVSAWFPTAATVGDHNLRGI